MNVNVKWILKNGSQDIDCSSFPYAFRTAFNLVRKALEAGKSTTELTKALTIVGPFNTSGSPRKYTYSDALTRAKDIGLVTPDGQINSREFKKKL